MARPASRSAAAISIRLVWPFLALARKHGWAKQAASVHKLLGLSQAQLDDPETRVPTVLVARLLEQAIRASGNRDIGLHAARFLDGAHVGIAEYLARSRPTLREALQAGARYVRLLGDGAHFGMERKGKLAIGRVWFDPQLVVHEAAHEFVLAISVLHARRITGLRELAPLEVHFMHAQPADIALHKKLFRCAVRFGMPATQTVMSAEFLEMRMAQAEPALGRLLEHQADAMLERLPDGDDLATRVRELLRHERTLRDGSAQRVARQLGMSVRTLSRRLDGERTSYRALLDEVRQQSALRELTQGTRPIAEIADRLGFASSQSFHRAFRRWTGTTAALARERARAAPPRSRSRALSGARKATRVRRARRTRAEQGTN
jgi:AraC-like DNA-binding protein